MNKKTLGQQGENLAARHLQSKGYRIITRNFRTRNGEIDLIATHNNILVFIEVKTRLTAQFGTPQEAITPWKLQALIRTAQYYKMLNPNLPEALRIDMIAVSYDSMGSPSIEHIENIS